MTAKLKPSTKEEPATEAKKESIIKELCLLFERLGYSVRRERLKQGHGWKVMSGSCRANESRLIFVDRRLSPADQMSFLLSKLVGLEDSLVGASLDGISDATRAVLQNRSMLQNHAIPQNHPVRSPIEASAS